MCTYWWLSGIVFPQVTLPVFAMKSWLGWRKEQAGKRTGFYIIRGFQTKYEHQSRQRVCIHIKVSYRHQHMLNRLLWTAASAESKASTRTAMQTAAEHQQRERTEARTAPTVLSLGRLSHFSSLCIISSLTSIFKNKCDCYKEQSGGGRLRDNYFMYCISHQRGLEDIAVFTKPFPFFIPLPIVMRLSDKAFLPIMWH